jgi:SAM-dependent methyltransferase
MFGTRRYWDELYQGRGDFPADEYRWYYGWEMYGKYVRQFVPDTDSEILIPGIGNDPVLLDMLQNRYSRLTATDYSEHAIERQRDLLSHARGRHRASSVLDNVQLLQMDARRMPPDWECKFDAIVEKGTLDAIYLSGDGNLELAVTEFERSLKPGGKLISVSGVVPGDLRREIFRDWTWFRDGGDDLQAGCFILGRTEDIGSSHGLPETGRR